jgi:hypothetical protein
VRDLNTLVIDLGGLNTEAIEQLGYQLYQELYLNYGHYGIHRTHDDQKLIFHGRQFEHAFYTTSDYRCHPDRKDVLRTVSLERIRWIGHVVSGRVPGSACFEIPSRPETKRPPKRLYAVFSSPYVVWLEPREDGGWKFSSAYPLSIEEIHKYCRGGRTIWKWTRKTP